MVRNSFIYKIDMSDMESNEFIPEDRKDNDSDGVPLYVKKALEDEKNEIRRKQSDQIALSDDELKILYMNPKEYYEFKFDNDVIIDDDTLGNNVRYSKYYNSFGIPKELNELFRVKKTQIIMMRERGYDISAEEGILQFTPAEFNEWITDWSMSRKPSFWNNLINPLEGEQNPTISFKHKSTKNTMSQPRSFLSNIYKKVGKEEYTGIVFYVSREKDKNYRIDKSTAEPIKNYLSGPGAMYEDIIFVSDKKFPARTKDLFSNLHPIVRAGNQKISRHVWYFGDKELWQNPLVHSLGAQYRLMTKEEKKEFKILYIHPLLISDEDPIVKFYGWHVDEIVVITRDISSMGGAVDTMIAKRLIRRDKVIGLMDKKTELVY